MIKLLIYYISFANLLYFILQKGNPIDFESLSLPFLKKYRSQFQIRIKPSVPKSELAAAIAEHFATIPIPEESEVIDNFLKALQKNRTGSGQSEMEDSPDEVQIGGISKKSGIINIKKKFTDKSGRSSDLNSIEKEAPKNQLQLNSKKLAKRPKV